MKIKEIKYCMQALVNIGNYENIKTALELTAETSEKDNIQDVIDNLRNTVKSEIRQQYKSIKNKKNNLLKSRI